MKFQNESSKDVITSDGKKIGKAYGTDDHDHLLVYKKGLLSDEQFKIPISAIIEEYDEISKDSIKLKLTEEQLKHAYKFLAAEPNSEFMHGKAESEPKLQLKKQVVQYEPPVSADTDNTLTVGSSPIPIKEGQGYSIPEGYRCDMCAANFNDVDLLEKHRSQAHKAPTNI